jgi:hypothetical protein
MVTGYKLFRVTRNGLKSLFIDRQRQLPEGVWLKARSVRTKGYAYRPGWHVLAKRSAPHLTTKGRTWKIVKMRHVIAVHKRPKTQGGVWYTAREIKIVREG